MSITGGGGIYEFTRSRALLWCRPCARPRVTSKNSPGSAQPGLRPSPPNRPLPEPAQAFRAWSPTPKHAPRMEGGGRARGVWGWWPRSESGKWRKKRNGNGDCQRLRLMPPTVVVVAAETPMCPQEPRTPYQRSGGPEPPQQCLVELRSTYLCSGEPAPCPPLSRVALARALLCFLRLSLGLVFPQALS